MIRLNLAPDAEQAAASRYAPHSHLPTWRADVGGRTTWRVMAMEGYAYLTYPTATATPPEPELEPDPKLTLAITRYAYLKHYSRFWLRPPSGHGIRPPWLYHHWFSPSLSLGL